MVELDRWRKVKKEMTGRGSAVAQPVGRLGYEAEGSRFKPQPGQEGTCTAPPQARRSTNQHLGWTGCGFEMLVGWRQEMKMQETGLQEQQR